MALVADEVWTRIRALEGAEFRQLRGKPFTFETQERTIRLHTTNRSISRTQVERAVAMWPVAGPGQFNSLQAPSYLYAILLDPRVIGSGR